MLLNSSQDPLCSGSRGFVLSDALIAVAVVSMLALLVHSALHTALQADEKIAESYQRSDESYEQAMERIGECVCETEEPDSEEPADTSLNSF